MVLCGHLAMKKVRLASLVIFSLLHLLPLSFTQTDDQVNALLAIKAAVGGVSTNLTSWNTTSRGPCLDKWSGVTCDQFSKITGLNMSSFLLQGKLPTNAFAKLTSLVSLDFSENSLESPFPAVDQLNSLHDLNFTGNILREPFPTSVFSLSNLVELRLDNNYLTGTIPEQISNLKLLEQLWLGNNTLSGPLPEGLATLYSLQTLTVWGNDLAMTLPAEWGAWVNITYINLHATFLSGPLPEEWGQSFTKLQKLDLYNNDLSGSIPDSWKGMTSLTEFKFKNNDLTGPAPSWLAQLLKNNATVDLTCNYLTGTEPSIFSDSTTWKGNCFDSDLRAHEQKCQAGPTCSDIINGVPKHKFPTGAIAGIIIAVIVVLCVILGLVYRTRRGGSRDRRRRRNDQGGGDWTVPQGVRRFTYKEISKATKSFDQSCEIGEGGFGKVYVGQLDIGKQVAIKRASDLSFQGTKEFQNEIDLLSRLHHRHLVQLEGFCDDRDEQILVYEYMSNGNLHHHLLHKHASVLNWYRRLEIALAVAQGLDYLHTFANPPVIHRDVKPSNILLDDNMVAKVSDFGISKANPEMDTHVSTRPAGTAGYLDPEYFLRRQLTTASDVYGYGVVLLELITGQLAIDHKRLEDYNLVGWVKPKLVRKSINAIIDPRLGPNFPSEQYKEVAHLAMACTAFERGDRPSMQTVATTLERVLSSLVPPPEHLVPFSSPSLTPLMKGKDTNSQISGGMAEPISDVKIEFGFRDSAVEPR